MDIEKCDYEMATGIDLGLNAPTKNTPWPALEAAGGWEESSSRNDQKTKPGKEGEIQTKTARNPEMSAQFTNMRINQVECDSL